MQCSLFSPDISDQVVALYTQVFSDSEGNDEGALIGALVRDLINTTPGEELIGCVACEQQRVVGAIFFSHFELPDGPSAMILSPVAVATELQGQGKGQQLINFGIEQLKNAGVEVLLTYGDPAYYGRVGFEPISEAVIPAPLKLSYPHGWLAQSLSGKSIEAVTGPTRCVKAFNDPRYW